MFYIELPWYALIIWIVFALLVLLPWIALPIIGISALFQGLFGAKRSIAKSPIGFQRQTGQLGLTMADGGKKVDDDSKKEDKDNS